MNVLITSASRKVSLVKAFQKALKQEGGGKVIATDCDPKASALYLADEHYLLPSSNHPDFLEKLHDLCKKIHIKLLVPTRDEELPLLAEHKDAFAQIGTLIMVSEPSSIKICQDKKIFIEFCKNHGFKIPKTYTANHEISDNDFPLFGKPRFGKGGQKTVRINLRDELNVIKKQEPDMILQEFVPAPEYTIDLFADFSGEVISVIPRERIKIFGGESFISQTTRNQLLTSEAIRITTELQLIGHVTIQCFLQKDTIKFIEINPRFGGGANLGFTAGAFSPLFLVKLLKGEPVKPQIGDYEDDLMMLRYTDDLFLKKKSLTVKEIT